MQLVKIKKQLLFVAAVVTTLGLVACAGSEGDDPGAACCDCLIDHGCWGYSICPVAAHCYCLYADDPPPSCEPDDTCFSADTTCNNNCDEECAEIADTYW